MAQRPTRRLANGTGATKDARLERRIVMPLTADARQRARVLSLTLSCTREHTLVNPMIACVIGFSAFIRKSSCPAGELLNQGHRTLDDRLIRRSGFHLWARLMRLHTIDADKWRTRDETGSGHCDHNWRSDGNFGVRRANGSAVDGNGRASSAQPLCARPGMLSSMQK
jgi:hypothetical protein